MGPDVGTDGLAEDWGTKEEPLALWCNPPGGRGKFVNGVWKPSKTGHQSSQRVFFEKFVKGWQAGIPAIERKPRRLTLLRA